ncbi:hypothetical protein LG3211_4548 [Lysobacter gummosus]|nr:hypothetical protein LG3211_4548 [Lysobacter gummosus]
MGGASAATLFARIAAPLRLAAFAMIATALAGCASTRADRAGDGATQLQLVLVTTADWNAPQGQLRRYLFDGHRWLAVGDPAQVTIGRNGSAWGRGLRAAPDDGGPVKREGDGRAPAGMFGIGTAFGYAERASTALPYAAMTSSDYCIDVSDSPLYNQIVDARKADPEAVKGTTEPMRRDLHAGGDQRYRQGFVIEHNPGRLAGAGSCIFAHLWKAPGETTAGCTAMDDAAMAELLAWLRPQARPVFVLLPRAQYARVWREWGLPAPESAR